MGAGVLSALGCSAIHAATVTVTTNADAGGACPGATCSLRQAIATASTGDTINFASAVSTITLTTAELSITKALTISGPGAALLRVQRDPAAATNFPIFHIPATGFAVTLSGITIAQGSGTAGGIWHQGTTLTVVDATIAGNSGTSGGGIVNSTGTLNVTRSTISGNTSSTGGGVRSDGALNITDSTISGNSASGAGGFGGGIQTSSGIATIVNSTVSNNEAKLGAGAAGIYVSSGAISLTNCTVADNITSAGATGGGIYNNSSKVDLKNTIVARNLAAFGPDLFGTAVSQGFNFIGNNQNGLMPSNTGDQIGTPAAPKDPVLGPLQDNGGPTFTRALLSGSLAINAGNSSGASADQRGLTRPVVAPGSVTVGDGSDIGAYEVQADVLPGCSSVNRIVNNSSDSGIDSLRDVLSKVCAGSTVTFAPSVRGTIRLLSLGDPQSALVINRSLTIAGPGADLLTLQRYNFAGVPNMRIFNVASGVRATVSGLTIDGGQNPGGQGGGLYSAGTLTLNDMAITNNTSSDGGGLYNRFGTMTVNNSSVATNTVNHPSIPGSGGGIHNFGGVLAINNSTISGNTAVGPSAGDSGGGIYTNVGTVTVIASTVTGNMGDIGGGIRNANGGSVTAKNSIIALNASPSGPDFNGSLTSQGFNIVGSPVGAAIAPSQFTDQIGISASQLKLGALQLNGGHTPTHALLVGSVAIDKGNASGLTTDQRGSRRPFDIAGVTNATGGDGADVGAFEYLDVRIDVDGNGQYDALTDGLMIIRYLFGLTGPSLTAGAIGPGSSRSSPAEILAYLDSIKVALDVDNNSQADALSDGLILLRYLFGLRGAALVNGALGANASRSISEIEAYIQTLMP